MISSSVSVGQAKPIGRTHDDSLGAGFLPFLDPVRKLPNVEDPLDSSTLGFDFLCVMDPRLPIEPAAAVELGLAGMDECFELIDPTSVLDEAASGLLANPLDDAGPEEPTDDDCGARKEMKEMSDRKVITRE